MGVVSQRVQYGPCGGMCVYGVSIARQSRDMRLDGTVGVCEWYRIEWSDRSFTRLHCTDDGQQPETSTWMSAVCQIDVKFFVGT